MNCSERSIIEKKRLHFVGICGKAMGGIAAALEAEGWKVTGSDEKCYQPMMGFLSLRGIPVRTPYAEGNVPREVDLVVVGKRVASAIPRRNTPANSGFPQVLIWCLFPCILAYFSAFRCVLPVRNCEAENRSIHYWRLILGDTRSGTRTQDQRIKRPWRMLILKGEKCGVSLFVAYFG